MSKHHPHFYFLLYLCLSLTLTIFIPNRGHTISPFRNKPIHLSLNDTTKTSLSGWNQISHKIDKITAGKFYQMTYISVPLIAAGFIIKSENDHFHDLRDDYIPAFRHHYDDYLQYLPGVAMLGMKAAGIKGRSSWGRMLTSDAFAITLMATTVSLLKSSIHEIRPDRSSANSFPSGHTATAFLAATMMHKEYGLTRSPWYSVGAYSVATVTAISRQMNNKHWMSDVLAGAGIGILSAELGYYLADLIFKDKGIQMPYITESPYDISRKPSFLGLYVGFNLAPTKIGITRDLRLKCSTGSMSGIEGAWFINHHVGIGGRFTISGNPLGLDYKKYQASQPELTDSIYPAGSRSIKTYSAMAGLYFSYPLTARWSVGSKGIAGICHWQDNHFFIEYTPEEEDDIIKQQVLTIKHAINPIFGTGLSLMYTVRPGLGIRFFSDYNLTLTRLVYQIPDQKNKDIHQPTHTFTLGASVNILLGK